MTDDSERNADCAFSQTRPTATGHEGVPPPSYAARNFRLTRRQMPPIDARSFRTDSVAGTGSGASLRLTSDKAARYNPLSLIHLSEPTRLGMISYAVFCLKKKKKKPK